jgi:hypothetical protein
MKKKILLFITLTSFLLIVSGFTSNFIKVRYFPVTISFNGIIKHLNDDYQIFNYNDTTYVPIRYFSEQSGAQVNYDPILKQIEVLHLDNRPLKSEINSVKTEEGFNLSLYSEKNIYNEGEVPRIWATLKNISNESKKIQTSKPLITFIIVGNNNNTSGDTILTVSSLSEFNPNDEYRRELPLTFSDLPLDENYPQPILLKPGSYTVRAVVEYDLVGLDDDVRKQLNTEITINIKPNSDQN